VSRIFRTHEEVEREMLEEGLISEEEIRESDMRAALMVEMIRARRDRGLSQRDLERMSGVRQPVISRIENGTDIPKLDTVMKVLAPLGLTLKLAPIEHGV
jgi:ribosome-binding protein aMBF1 (putative translation factor)